MMFQQRPDARIVKAASNDLHVLQNCLPNAQLQPWRLSIAPSAGRMSEWRLSLPGTRSTVGHWDQSRVAIFWLSFIVALYHGSATVAVRVATKPGDWFTHVGRVACESPSWQA